MSQPGADSGAVSADDAARAAASPAATTPAVAETLGLLDTLAERPLAEHPDLYQRAHTRLQQALAEIDDA